MHPQIVLPPKLSRALSNIDTQASRTDRNRPTCGLVDTVWLTVVLEADGGRIYARQRYSVAWPGNPPAGTMQASPGTFPISGSKERMTNAD